MLFYGPQMGFRTGTEATKTRAHTRALVSKRVSSKLCFSVFSEECRSCNPLLNSPKTKNFFKLSNELC